MLLRFVQRRSKLKKVFDIIKKEKERQNNEICLIASENYTYKEVMKAQGSCLTNKYAEGYPDNRYYGGCHFIDEIENLAIDNAKKLFRCKFANVQPHSGSQANQAVYLAFCEPNDVILGMSLDAGGHLTHGAKVSSSGKLYKSYSYGLTDEGLIDLKDLADKLYIVNPRVLIVGASAYPRKIDFKAISKIVKKYNKFVDRHNKSKKNIDNQLKHCIYMVDMAHIAGLVATKNHESPLKYADVVTSTTHKTLRGPRGGLILTNNEEYAKLINKAVFPGVQGGPLEHVIAAKAICFDKARKKAFKQYIKQVLLNIKAMEKVFNTYKVPMITGGSDNHLILLDFRGLSITGKQIETELEKNGIIVNKNAVVNDKRSRFETSGIRLGTACITARGMKETEATQIAKRISEVIIECITKNENKYEFDKWQQEIKRLTSKFPIK